MAAQVDATVIERITEAFLTESQNWASKLESSVKSLFVLLFGLEIVMLGITAVMKRESLEDLFSSIIMAVLFGSFILACIMNYKEWSHAIMGGLTHYTGLLGYDSATILKSPLQKGFEIFRDIKSLLTILEPINSIAYLLVGFAILITFAFMTIQIIYIKCEAFVAVGAGFILLGFGGCHFFKEYALNMMKYILSVGFKLYVLYIVLGLGFHFLDQLPQLQNPSMEDLAVILITALIMLTLSKSLPDVASGIIQGAHVGTGNNFVQTAMQVGGAAAVGTYAATKGTIGGGIVGYKADQVAKAAGATGMGRVGSAAKAAWNANKQANADRPSTKTSAISAKLESMHEQHKLK